MKQKLWSAIVAVAGLIICVAAPAESSTHEFYKGETIRFVVGYGPGGGYYFLPKPSANTWASMSPAILPSSLKTCPARAASSQRITLTVWR